MIFVSETAASMNLKFNMQHDQTAGLQTCKSQHGRKSKMVADTKNTLKCLSIGTPKIINFPFVSYGKLMFFRGPNILAHCNEPVLCLNFGTLENNEFSIWNKWKIYYF